MWRCLILAVGAALARSDTYVTPSGRLESGVREGDFSVLNDVEAVRGKLATFEEQMINDETLPFLEASDLLELGVSPMAILAIVDISSAARGKAKKLDAEDVLHDVATHQSVLEKELAEHRAEIARLRMNRRGEVPDHMCCPILMDVMRDPVIAADGHTYEKVAIEQWFLKARTSPTTNEPLASLALLPNHAIRSAIAEEMERRRS